VRPSKLRGGPSRPARGLLTHGQAATLGRYEREGLVRSREILRGTRVRVSEGHRRPELRGLLGTVAQKWGNSDYTALLVWLETG
jgi:hypothetical protein